MTDDQIKHMQEAISKAREHLCRTGNVAYLDKLLDGFDAAADAVDAVLADTASQPWSMEEALSDDGAGKVNAILAGHTPSSAANVDAAKPKELLAIANHIDTGLSRDRDADEFFAPPLSIREWREIVAALRHRAGATNTLTSTEPQEAPVIPKAMHWLGDREDADETRHAVDTTGCVLYFGSQGDCLEFMNSVLSALPRPERSHGIADSEQLGTEPLDQKP